MAKKKSHRSRNNDRRSQTKAGASGKDPDGCKEIEQGLQPNTDWFQIFLENTSDGINICEYDPISGKRRLILCNDRYLEMSGYTREELENAEDVNKFVEMDVSEKELKYWNNCIMNQKGFAGVGSWKRPDGKENIYEFSAVPVKKGEKYHIFGVDRDITERKQAEEALQESEERFRTSVETLLDGFAIFSAIRDETGRIVDFRYEYINDAGCRLNLRTREQQIGHTLLELLPAHKESGLFDEYVRLVETGQSLVRESVLYEDVFGRGQRLDRAFSFQAVKLGGGFAVNWRDITERKQAEEERANLAKFPSENPNPVLRITKDGKVLYCNEAGHPLLAKWKSKVGKTVPKKWHNLIAAAFESEKIEEEEEEVRGRTFSFIIAPVRDADYANIYGRDITHRKQTEEALRSSESTLRQIIDLVPAGIFIKDHEGRYILVNQNLADLHRKTVEEITGKLMTDVFSDESQEENQSVLADDRKIIETGQPMVVSDDSYTADDGQRQWLHTIKVPYEIPETGERGVLGVSMDITKLKQTEEALQRSESTLRQIIDLIPAYVYIKDRQGRFLLVNRVFAERWGVTVEKMTGELQVEICSMFRSSSQEEIQAVQDTDREVIETGQSLMIQQGPYTISDGKQQWVHTIKVPYEIPDTGERGVLGVSVDITDRVRAEEKLRVSESELSAIYENAPLIMLLVNRERRIVKLNAPAVSMARRSVEEAVGLRGGEALRCIHASDDPKGCGFGPACETCGVRNTVMRTFQSGKAFHRMEASIPYDHPDGPVDMYVLISTSLLSVSEEDLVLVCLEDITDRKRAEDALRRSESTLRQIIDLVPAGIFIKDHEGRYILVNKNFADLHRMTVEEITGGRTEDIFPYSQEEAQRTLADDRKVIETGKPLVISEEFFDTSDGQRQWLHTIKVPYEIPKTSERGVLGVIVDINDRKQIEEQLRHAQKMEAIGELAGGIAHDFRNQLMVIAGFGKMLLRQNIVGEDGQKKVLEILHAAERSMSLTDKLLAFGRKQLLQPKVVNLTELVMDLSKSLPPIIGEDIRLSIIPGPGKCHANLDPGQFEQAIMNLIINARDAMPEGGKLTIETSCFEPDDKFVKRHPNVKAAPYAMVTVRDTGVGMRGKMMERIFDPFFTNKEPGEGTGLGLAMVYGFVRQSGGTIEVDSELGKGATFRLYFPRVEKTPDVAPITTHPEMFSQGSETILVVEDEKAVRRLVVEFLRECGYTVLEAGNASEALPLEEHYDGVIDVLITDLVMPGMNGVELAERIMTARPDIKTLYITGYADKDLIKRGLEHDETNLLIKPIDSKVLADTVRMVLDGKLGPSQV